MVCCTTTNFRCPFPVNECLIREPICTVYLFILLIFVALVAASQMISSTSCSNQTYRDKCMLFSLRHIRGRYCGPRIALASNLILL